MCSRQTPPVRNTVLACVIALSSWFGAHMLTVYPHAMGRANPLLSRLVSDNRRWWGLGVLLLPVLLVSMDSSVLFLAMPMVTDGLDPSPTQTLWILDSYSFVIAGLLITMGSLGDRVGRRRLLLMGATVFGIGSVVAAFSVSPTVLIVARA